ncbi:hypothetical protein M9H77_19022 [Catharanthus roseus]|uniref:Uncharacterized protein n=1 Tax=Catharanthus roseus TaxID=4058 RepID=A0ACC0B933_CATRO|nr:hypothetical protein M9H77_19022 [Catharanthus roseus]
MVRSGAHRGDDNLGPVTDRTGRVQGRTITASSQGLMGNDIVPPNSLLLLPILHLVSIMVRESILEFIGQSRQIGAEFFNQMFGATPQDFSCSIHGYSYAEYGVSSSVPYVPRPADRVCEGDLGFEGGAKKKKVKASDWEQTEPAEGGPVDPELIPSYGGYDRGSLKFRSRYMALTSKLHAVTTSRQTSLSPRVRAACYLQYILGSSPFSDKSSNIAWIYLYFPIFAPPVRLSTKACKPYIQQSPMLGYKNKNKLLDICLRLDVMTADEVMWVPYKMQEIRACWVSTWHGFIAYFDCIEPYMPDRVLR